MPMEPLRSCGIPLIPSSGTHPVVLPVGPLVVAPMGNGLDHVIATRFPTRKVIPPGVPFSAFPVEANLFF